VKHPVNDDDLTPQEMAELSQLWENAEHSPLIGSDPAPEL
jgi:hypothetical protein